MAQKAFIYLKKKKSLFFWIYVVPAIFLAYIFTEELMGRTIAPNSFLSSYKVFSLRCGGACNLFYTC